MTPLQACWRLWRSECQAIWTTIPRSSLAPTTPSTMPLAIPSSCALEYSLSLVIQVCKQAHRQPIERSTPSCVRQRPYQICLTFLGPGIQDSGLGLNHKSGLEPQSTALNCQVLRTSFPNFSERQIVSQAHTYLQWFAEHDLPMHLHAQEIAHSDHLSMRVHGKLLPIHLCLQAVIGPVAGIKALIVVLVWSDRC